MTSHLASCAPFRAVVRRNIMGWDLLGGIMNIAHMIHVILRHVQAYQRLHEIMKEAEFKAKRIESNVRQLESMYKLDGVQAQVISAIVQDFRKIYSDLVAVRDKLADRSAARTFLSSPEALEKLSSIETRLSAKDDTIKLMTMMGAFNLEHRDSSAHIVSLLTQLRMTSSDGSLMESLFTQFFRSRMLLEGVQDIPVGGRAHECDQRKGLFHLSTGICLYNGEFGVKNFEEAARLFNMALKAGRNEACYYLGMQYKYGQGVEVCNITAKNFFQRGTNAGVPGAMSQLGDCYGHGIGVEKSHSKSLKLLKRAAEAGDPNGMSIYAWFKLYGRYTDVNLPLAYQMSNKAVNSGFGMYELACCYEQGIVVDRDPKEAIRLLTESIDGHENWGAPLLLARIYEQGNGIDVDLRTAAEWYRRGTEYVAWQRPYFHAFYGMCLIRGRGVPQDVEKGWVEVDKSIQGNNASGWFVKGECYRFGYGVEQDHSRALNCYRRAVQAKHGTDGKLGAEFALGCMHEAGEGGLSCDLATAFEHFVFAANRMHQEAQWKVAMFCETGTGLTRQVERAVHYFRLAANSGHRDAQLKASKYYMKGKGVSRDLHTAVQILRPAAENGDLDAQRLLRRMERRVVLRRLLPIRTKSLPTSLTWFSSS